MNVDSVVVAEAPSGVILFSTAEPASVVGRSLSELADHFAMFHADGRPYAASEWQIARSIASGEVVVDEEFFRIADDGSRVRYRCSSYPVYDRTGGMVAAVALARDVSEIGRVEHELAYHASVLENVEDAIVGTDPEFRLTVWNRGAERLYGFTAEEVLGRDARDVASYPGDKSRLELERDLLENDRTRTEITALRKDGTPVDVELISVAVRDDKAAISGYLGIHRDITERKRGERALLAARQRTETILESVTDAFYALDRDWRLTYLNERAVQSFADLRRAWLTREDLLGRSVWDLFPDMVGSTVYTHYHHAVRDGRTAVFEYLHPPDGPWFDVHAFPSDHGLAVYFRDITDRKSAEDERDHRAHQQALVAELGQRALAGDEVQAVMDDAVAIVERALDLAPAGIAEIVPVEEGLRGSLVGYTAMVGQPVVSEDVAADPRFEMAPSAREHGLVSAATAVIAGREQPFAVLVAFSGERRSFSADDVHFLQAVANVVATAVARVDSQKRMVEVRDAERRRIARDLHDEALQALTDALADAIALGPAAVDAAATARLARLVPALKRAGLQLSGTIYDLRLGAEEDRPLPDLLRELVDVHRAMASECRIELDIRSGVPAASLGRLGTELVRVAGEALLNARRHAGARTVRVAAWGSRNRVFLEVSDDGRGFDVDAEEAARRAGTSGMRERADLVAGDLEIRSAPGAGTTVRFSVALPDDLDAPEHELRVLLVEDHVAVREAIAGMFERELDFRVVGQAASLAEAREMLEHVDVAVVDLGLPDGYGGDLIKDLHAVSPRAQALVLSATLDERELAQAIESGAAGALNKAVHLDEVVDAIRRLHAGQSLIPVEEIVQLLRFAGRERARERDDRRAIESLTAREREILQALADGLDSNAIADRLHIALRTERNHIANILTKLGVHSQLQALVFALRYGAVKIH